VKIARVADLGRLHQAMAAARLDAIVVNSPANVWYLSGYPLALSGLQGRGYGRNASVVVPAGREPILVPGRFEEQITRARAWATDIEPFNDYVEVPVAAAAQVIRRRGIAHDRVGVELEHLSARFMRALRETLAGAELIAADETLDRVRAVKSPAEIEGMESALKRAARGAADGLFGAKAGQREFEVHTHLVRSVVRTLWSEKVDGATLSGPRTMLWNGQSGDRRLAPDDWVRLDYTCVAAGYPARICRMGTVGRPTPAQTGLFDGYVQGVREALPRLRPGMTGADAHALLVEALGAKRVQVVQGALGYGLGYGPVERPYLAASEVWALAPGVVLSVEPATIDGLQASWLVVLEERVARVVETPFPPETLFTV
jgi:Xaa-Pro aminopeptidase